MTALLVEYQPHNERGEPAAMSLDTTDKQVAQTTRVLLSFRFLWCKAARPLVKSEVRIVNRVSIFLLDSVFGY